jgi:hypothetical protein
MTVILNFTNRKPRQKARRPARGPAACVVHAFPVARNSKMIANVAELMKRAAKQTSGNPLDAAEEVLLDTMEVVWSVLADRGVAEDEREREAHDLARLAWAKFGSSSDRIGVA